MSSLVAQFVAIRSDGPIELASGGFQIQDGTLHVPPYSISVNVPILRCDRSSFLFDENGLQFGLFFSSDCSDWELEQVEELLSRNSAAYRSMLPDSKYSLASKGEIQIFTERLQSLSADDQNRYVAEVEGADPAFVKQYMQEQSQQQQQQPIASVNCGIGVAVQNEHGRWLIASVNPDGPAARAGIISGSYLVSVNGQRTDGMSSVYALIVGPEHTIVDVGVALSFSTTTVRRYRLVRAVPRDQQQQQQQQSARDNIGRFSQRERDAGKAELFPFSKDLWKREEDGTSVQAKNISHFGGVLGEKLRNGAVYSEQWLIGKSREKAVRLRERQQPTQLTTTQKQGIEVAKTLSDGLLYCTNVVVSGVEAVGKTVGAAVGAAYELLPPPKDERIIVAGQMAGATAGAVANGLFALRDAAIVMLDAAKTSAVTLAEAKYGFEVGNAVDQSIGAVYNVGYSAANTLEVAMADSIMGGIVHGIAVETALEAGSRIGRSRELTQGIVLFHGISRYQEVAGVWVTLRAVARKRALCLYPMNLPIPEIDAMRSVDNNISTNSSENLGGPRMISPAEIAMSNGLRSTNNYATTNAQNLAEDEEWVIVEEKVSGNQGIPRRRLRAAKKRKGEKLTNEVVGAGVPERILSYESIMEVSMEGDEGGFKIVMRERRLRPYYFEAKNEFEAAEWVKVLTMAVEEERKLLLADPSASTTATVTAINNNNYPPPPPPNINNNSPSPSYAYSQHPYP